MAIAEVDHWRVRTAPAAPVYRPLILPYARPLWFGVATGIAVRWRLERLPALILSCSIAAAVLGALARLTDAPLPQLVDRFPLVLALIAPNSSSAAVPGASPTVRREVAQAPVPPSPIETSTPTPVSRHEWSVSRIPVIGPARAGEAASDGRAGAGANGAGANGAGGYDPYAGAAPRWQPAANDRGDGIDDRQLQSAIAEVKRRFPRARGTVDLRLKLSPGGMVLDVEFMSPITPGLAAAMRKAMVGRPLAARSGDMIGGLASERILTGVVIGQI